LSAAEIESQTKTKIPIVRFLLSEKAKAAEKQQTKRKNSIHHDHNLSYGVNTPLKSSKI
jgi:hypothetical protein